MATIPGEPVLQINPAYGQLDVDSDVLLYYWEDGGGPTVLEVGANEEPVANILTDNGYDVVGVDLRNRDDSTPRYQHLQADFLRAAPYLRTGISPGGRAPDILTDLLKYSDFRRECFHTVFSLSALEHFGLDVYGGPVQEDYDAQAARWMYSLLADGGLCFITVPYGKHFRVDRDWRVYNRQALQDRIIQDFKTEEQLFFLSGGCDCPTLEDGVLVDEADADAYAGELPHLTVFLRLRKG